MKLILALLLAALVLAACDTNTAALPEGTLDVLSVETQGYVGIPQEPTSAVFPSTNQNNIDNGWANVLINGDDAVQLGSVELLFTSTRTFPSCFEYRLDDEDPTDPRPNWNGDIDDGMWAYTCVNNSTAERTLTPNEYVDVRLSFGGETDERFAWNRFWVLTELTKDDCKNGSWQTLGYRNQGQCIASIEANANSVH